MADTAQYRRDDADGGGGTGEEHALGERQPQQLQTAGTERAAHGNLRLPGRHARQHQVGGVRAGDEHDASDGREQEQQQVAHRRGDAFEQRIDGDAHALVHPRIGCGEPVSDTAHIVAGLRDRHAWLQTPNHLVISLPARLAIPGDEHARDPRSLTSG